jgi:Ca2+-binding RTX toxin-like protein
MELLGHGNLAARRAAGRQRRGSRRRLVALATSLLLGAALSPLTVLAPPAAQAAAPVGQGFTVTPSDLAFILKQIKISEAHVRNTTSETGPCGALVGNGPNQIPSPLVSYGLRTVDGSCNNLIAGQERFGSADQKFPRLATADFKDAEPVPPGFPGQPNAPTTYKSKKGFVYDSQPRVISNLIVDQTSTNPAAVAAAAEPVRTQGNEGVVPCTTEPSAANPNGVPTGCTPAHETLFIPNVTTDVGLSPPYNQLFTLFGQFFDHGVDLTTKSGGTVFVPLKSDDPLIPGPDHQMGTGCGTAAATAACADNLPQSQQFMVLTRAQNQPGKDGILGDLPNTAVDESADDVQEATNTDSPWADQSQTYTSHPSHQVFLREYTMNPAGDPVSTGKLLGSADGGMATWAMVKQQAAQKLGIQLTDPDVLNIPLIAADPYGKFLPGPNGFPQIVTASGLVEGNPAANGGKGVLVPANARHVVACAPAVSCNEGFLVDIAHNANPTPQDTDHNPATAPVAPTPDADAVPSTDFASQPPGTYDDEMLNMHFACGDGRCNENIGLSSIHQIFHSEHDRLVDDIKNVLTSDTTDIGVAALPEWKLAEGAGGWNGERLFQAARFVTEMEYQHIVFEEFARKVQPAINPFEPFAFTQTELNPAVKAEFAHAVYRFGHSMLTDSVNRIKPDGTHDDLPLMDAFLNPVAFKASGANSEEAAGAILMGASDETGNELDEFVTETLRNNLLGLPLDLATINMTRAREAGIPPLNVVRRQIWQATNDGQLQPYSSWIDFGQNLKHPESLVNFVAAYGRHSTITGVGTIAGKRSAAARLVYGVAGPDGYETDLSSTPDVNETADNIPAAQVPGDRAEFMNGPAATTGVDSIDLWVGGLAEKTNLFGGLLGSTFNFVFENQLTDLQNGDRLYYLARTPGMNLRSQLEGNSFAELVMRNTNAHSLKADAFATSDCKFELKNLAGTVAGYQADGNTVDDDVTSECDETALLIRLPDGTIRYRERNAVDPSGINGQSVFNGTANVDRVWGGVDNDTFLGNEGNDIIEGNDGADVALGGDGNDRITDSAGDDNLKGGPGNDALDAGIGLDILHGGTGKDFTNGGANANETFAGGGDDFTIAGQGIDAIFGDGGDDWEEGGDQPDLLQGDAGNLFFLDDGTRPGHDILIGQGGDDDYDFEGGDDIGLGGPGIEKIAGASGYDWEIGQGDPQPQNQDLELPLPGTDILLVDTRDRFIEVEALSGWKFNDVLNGDDFVTAQVGGAGFIGCDALDQAGLDRIKGLDDIVPPLTIPVESMVSISEKGECPQRGNVWGGGNILLGGAGSDTITGRGANDIIDGDRYVSVRLSVRTNPNNPNSEIGSASVEGTGQSAMNSQYLRDSSGKLTGPTLQQAVFNGTLDPGNIVAVREILSANNPGVDKDTAVYEDTRDSYMCTDLSGATPVVLPQCPREWSGRRLEVSHLGGGGVEDEVGAEDPLAVNDGTDIVYNVEELVFSDSIPPAPPTGVTAEGRNKSGWVEWLPSASPVTSYQVQVLDSSGTQVGVLRDLLEPPDIGIGLLVNGLTNRQTYTFKVRGVNNFGPGDWSAPSNPVVPHAALPDAPERPQATEGDRQVKLSWTAPFDGGALITGYEVQVSDASGPMGGLRSTTDTTFKVTGLENSKEYFFQVRAVNEEGSGAWSPEVAAVPRTWPGLPHIKRLDPRDRSVMVHWTSPADDGGSPIVCYRIQVLTLDGQQVGRVRTADASARRLLVKHLDNGRTYRLRMKAKNEAGGSAWTAPMRFRPSRH